MGGNVEVGSEKKIERKTGLATESTKCSALQVNDTCPFFSFFSLLPFFLLSAWISVREDMSFRKWWLCHVVYVLSVRSAGSTTNPSSISGCKILRSNHMICGTVSNRSR